MCGAGPYWGTLQLLWLLLGSVFLHHTLEPVRPCRSFHTCAHALRDMQGFHQDTHTGMTLAAGHCHPLRELAPPKGAVTVPWWPCHHPKDLLLSKVPITVPL